MRKYTILLAILLAFAPKIYPQANITRLNVLPSFTDNVRYDLALTQQLGVIGNNYYGDVPIGKAPFEAVGVFNSHYPLDGYKRTICGTLHSYYIKTEDKVDDDDVHFIIRPEFYSKNLLAAHNQAIVSRNIDLAKANPLTKPRVALISNPDITTVNGIEVYNKTIGAFNSTYYPTQPHFFRDLKYAVLGEIDLPFHGSLTKYGQNVPKQELNCACIFGAWVNDRLSVPFGSYHDYIEIHPTEQAWWSYKKNNNETVYYLGAFGDNSGRFYVRDNYDTEGGDLSFFGTWLTCPQTETFAVPFEIKNKMPTLVYSVEKKVSNGGFFSQPGEPSTPVLMYRSDTLLRVHNRSLMSVRFEKVGVSKIVNQDTFVRGYVVFQAFIKGTGACTGTSISKLTVNKNIKTIGLPTAINQPATVKVTLKNIQCLGVDDGNDKEEIIGYAGVTAYSPKTPIAKLPIAPKEQENFLLFSRLDQSYLEMAKNQTIDINESHTFELTNEDYIVINSDLDEDDDNEDGNINDLDDDDDRLADANDKGKAVKTDILYVKNLIGTNKKLETKHVFTSGGTKVVLSFLLNGREGSQWF